MLSSKPICDDGSKYGSVCKLCPDETRCQKIYGKAGDLLLFKKGKHVTEEAPKYKTRIMEI